MQYFLSILLFFLFSCNKGNVDKYTQTYLNHNDTVKYVGKEQCRICHQEIYDSYINTGMGKSFNYAVKEHSVLLGKSIPIVYDSIKNLSYQPFFKNDSLYIKEFRLNQNKDTIHKLVQKVKYKIGSGHHTNSHIFEVNGFAHQVPYTYYTQNLVADLPPGFEDGNNSRFSREIGIECMSCHNAYPHYDTTSINKYNMIPNGIDCERCHGPGELHVKRKMAGELIDTSKYIDFSIVNPSKLSDELQFDVCQRCHLQGTSILKDGKSFTSFKPGNRLSDVMDTYLPRFEDDNTFIMASHADRLKQSSCFQNSDLNCTSCHNPHNSIENLESNFFDNKCMQCHELCKDDNINNCTSCHMPKSGTSDILHVSITDHKIGISSKSEAKERGKFLGLYAINNNNPDNISKAKAYLKRYESFEQNPIYLDSAFRFLKDVENNYTSYIQYYYLGNDSKGLINFVLSNEIEQSAYSIPELALAYSRIGEVFSSNDIKKTADIYFRKSINLMPNVIDYKIKYGTFLINNNDLNDGKDIFIEALALNPTIKEIHLNLGLIAILNKDYNIANKRLKHALALDPDYILAYENLALLSQRMNKMDEVKLYLNKILEIAPDHKANILLNNL
tara:strand:+ start:8243 stop:10090 length:1848 start_codon:yes stop_codon:yes gene_type:complete